MQLNGVALPPPIRTHSARGMLLPRELYHQQPPPPCTGAVWRRRLLLLLVVGGVAVTALLQLLSWRWAPGGGLMLHHQALRLPGGGAAGAVTAQHQLLQQQLAAGGSSDSPLVQLTRAYEASLSELSAALDAARQKAIAASVLREQLTAARAQRQQEQLRQRTSGAAAAVGQQAAHAAGGSAVRAAASLAGAATPLRRVRLFIGVYTGFSTAGAEARYDYAKRRAAIRATWFGSSAERQRLEAEQGVVLRFVVGHSADADAEAALQAEQQQHGDFMKLPLQETYGALPNKTRIFFKVVSDALQPDWIIKMDDDVYLNVGRLLAAARQWDAMRAQYVGCMKHGLVWTRPGTRWYEPAHLLVGPTYWLHAYGSVYAIAGPIARSVISGPLWPHLRLLANEDTSVGLWMLAANVTHFEDMRLCSPTCTPASVGVLRNECAGLCQPLEELPLLHANATCRGPPQQPLPYHPSYPEHRAFEHMWV